MSVNSLNIHSLFSDFHNYTYLILHFNFGVLKTFIHGPIILQNEILAEKGIRRITILVLHKVCLFNLNLLPADHDYCRF